jgi:hypothetical protein
VYIEAFLNEAVHSPLPEDCLKYVKAFLELSDDSSIKHWHNLDYFTGGRTARAKTDVDSDGPIAKSLTDASKHMSQFSTELDESCDQNLKAIKILESMHAKLSAVDETAPLRATHKHSSMFLPSLQLSDGIRSVLNEIMLERDEAQCRLSLAETLHKNERDELHFRVSDLTSQLEATKRGQDLQSDKNGEKTVLSIHENKAIYDSDLELQSLCQQLAGEISARTTAKITIVRMKESRKLEQELEASERQALQDEVVKLRELVQQMSTRETEILQESRIWRESFEALVKYKADSATNSSKTSTE